MDSLLQSLKYVNSFHTNIKTTNISLKPNIYTNKKEILVPLIKESLIVNYIDEPLKYVNESLYNKTLNLASYNHPIKYFINQQITIYANIDAIYNLFDIEYPNVLKRNNALDFTYLVAQDAKGNFVQYTQYRKTNAFGVGITNNNDWNYKIINTELFNPYDGYDLTGNITSNWKQLIIDANGDIRDKYNLVLCNDYISEKYNRSELELLYVDKFIIQCIIGLECSTDKFVVHCYDIHSVINAQIIYLLSLCFESISIIKPVTSDVSTSDKYIVCEKIRSDIYPYIKLLRDASNYINEHTYISNLFKNPLPKKFTEWLTDRNNEILKYQLMSFDNYNFDNISLYLNVSDYIEK